MTLCLALVAAATGLASSSLPAPAVSALPVPAVSTLPAASSPIFCLRGFSKNVCSSPFYPGHSYSTGCSSEDCKTMYVEGATLKLEFTSNRDSTACGCPCDEVPRKDGTFKVDVRYELRLTKPCPYRGCMEGYAEYHANDGSVYIGNFTGTIGVGTHRASPCPVFRVGTCEPCWDVSFDACCGNTWRIGWEGVFKGRRVDAGTDEELCFSISGDFYTTGTCDGPNLDDVLKVVATADGVAKDRCD